MEYQDWLVLGTQPIYYFVPIVKKYYKWTH